MRRLRRLTALLACILFAHVLWVGSGFACAMPDMPAAEHSPSGAMAGMDMSDDMTGMDMTGMDMTGMEMPGATGQRPDQGSEHHHAPCDFPSTRDDCQSMAPCAPLALVSVAESPRVSGVMPSTVAPLTELAPPSQVSQPESPPPRA